MVLFGTIVNAVAIVAGALLGTLLSGIKESVRTTVMQGIALAVLILGIKMGMESDNFLLVIFSLVLGSILGEWWGLEEKLNAVGLWLENRIGGKRRGSVATAFVTTTLVYCVGAMAILGSIDSGLRNDHQILLTKSMLDGFSAIIFASALGIGVLFSAIPVLIYEGLMTLGAHYINQIISKDMLLAIVKEVTSAGGIMIIAIAVNLLELKKIRTANMLPAILIAAIGVPVIQKWPHIQEWFASLF